MKWISVKEEIPPLNKFVLVFVDWNEWQEEEDRKAYRPKPQIFVAYRNRYDSEYTCAYGDGYIPSDITITHWKNLPEPPKD